MNSILFMDFSVEITAVILNCTEKRRCCKHFCCSVWTIYAKHYVARLHCGAEKCPLTFRAVCSLLHCLDAREQKGKQVLPHNPSEILSSVLRGCLWGFGQLVVLLRYSMTARLRAVRK